MKDMILTPPLTRAARGLLAWQQTDLAREAGISLAAVKNFESGKKKPHVKTAQAIRMAFERHGVEFPASGGLRQTEDLSAVFRFAGTAFLGDWYEDVYAAMSGTNGDILTSSIGESWWDHPSVRKANEAFLVWQRRTQTPLKVLTPDSLPRFNLPRAYYRLLPRDLLGKVTYCLYADRLAYILWKKRQIIVLRNASVAETIRSQFLALWKQARKAA